MSSAVRIKLPPLHAGQQQVAHCDARFIALVSGRQWGKTRTGVWVAMRQGLRGECWWWVAPVYQTSEIAWKLMRKLAAIINAMAPNTIDVRLGDRAMVFPNGGEVLCRSADRPDNLRGPTLDGVVVDEADYCDQYVWEDVLTPALGVKRGRAILTSSPRLENGWFHNVWRSGCDNDEERGNITRDHAVQSFRFPTWTSPFFDPDSLEHARRRLPQLTFRREYGAEFVSHGGAMVKREYLRYGLPVRELEIYLGVDVAISKKTTADYSAVAVLARDKATGIVYVLEVVRDRVSFRGLLAMIVSLATRWNPVVIAIEQVAFQAAVVQELLTTTTLPVVGVNPSTDKVLRFQPMTARYEQGLVCHAPGLIPEWEDELLAFPVGANDDMIDAVSYAFAAIDSFSGAIIVAGDRPDYGEMHNGEDLRHLAAMG